MLRTYISHLFFWLVLASNISLSHASSPVEEAQSMAYAFDYSINFAKPKCRLVAPDLAQEIEQGHEGFRKNLKNEIESGQKWVASIEKATGRDFSQFLIGNLSKTLPGLFSSNRSDQVSACNEMIRLLQAQEGWTLDDILRQSFSIDVSTIEKLQKLPCEMTGVSTASFAKGFIQKPPNVDTDTIFLSLLKDGAQNLLAAVDNCLMLQAKAPIYRTSMLGNFADEQAFLQRLLGIFNTDQVQNKMSPKEIETAIKSAQEFLRNQRLGKD